MKLYIVFGTVDCGIAAETEY